MGFEPRRDVKVQAVDKFVDNLQEEAKAALHKAHDDMKHFADHMCWSTKNRIKCGLVPRILISIDH